jgi:hypothetical protein
MGFIGFKQFGNRFFYSGGRTSNWGIQAYSHHLVFFLLFGYFFAIKFPLVWNSNDDFVMKRISEGLLSKTNSEFLIFINPLVGLLLKFLYSVKPVSQWYSWMFVFLYAICNSVLSFLIFRKGFSSLSQILFLSLFPLFLIKINTEYQFTLLASYLAISGYFLLFLSIYDGVSSRFWILFSCLLLVVSSLFRIESFLMISVFFSPFFLLFFPGVKRLYTYLIVAGFLVLSTKLFFVKYYASEDWKYYKEYNASRAIIVDSPPADYSKIRKEVEKVGWKIFDLELFKGHYFESSEIFSLDKINQVNLIYKRKFLVSPNIFFVEKNGMYLSFLFGLLALSVLFFNRKISLYILVSVLICFSALILISVSRKIPERVFMSFLQVSFLAVILFNSPEDSSLFKRLYNRLQKFSPYVVVLLFWFSIQKLLYVGEVNARQIDLQQKLLSEFKLGLKNFAPKDSELGVITSHGTGSTFFGISVFDLNSHISLDFIKVIYSGWLTKSPLKREYMRQFGDEEKPDYQLSVNNPKVVFLDETNNSVFEEYLSYHYPEVKIDTFYIHPSRKFCGFRLVK